MFALSLFAATLASPVHAAEPGPRDAWAVGGATAGGAVLGTAAGFGVGIGLVQVVCSAAGRPAVAWGCIMATAGGGATLGYVGGASLAGSWTASRRGLDARQVRRRTWIAMGGSAALMGVGLVVYPFFPAGAAGMLIGVPVVAGLSATRPGKLTLAPVLGPDTRGLVAQVRF